MINVIADMFLLNYFTLVPFLCSIFVQIDRENHECATKYKYFLLSNTVFPTKIGPRTIHGPPKFINWSMEIYLEQKSNNWLFVVAICCEKLTQKGPPSIFLVNRKKFMSFMVRVLKKFRKHWSNRDREFQTWVRVLKMPLQE